MSERGIAVDHATLSRWVHLLVPLIVKRYRRNKPDVGRRWRMDETFIKIKGHGVTPIGRWIQTVIVAPTKRQWAN